MINKLIMICCNNVISLIIFYVPFPIAINDHYVTTVFGSNSFGLFE